MVEIMLFQHTPCQYLPASLIDQHPIWPPQPVHSHRLVRAIVRQISSANISLLRYERLPFASQLGWLGLLRHVARHWSNTVASEFTQMRVTSCGLASPSGAARQHLLLSLAGSVSCDMAPTLVKHGCCV